MDRTTEPVIAVLGHPIAGNAAQFALERAFAAMQLDWRVLSFDVTASHLHLALEGLDVLGVEGVLIDPSLSDAAQRWARSKALSVSIAPDAMVAPDASLAPDASVASDASVAPDASLAPDADLASSPHTATESLRFDSLFRDHSAPGVVAPSHTPSTSPSPLGWSLLDAAGSWLVETTREHFETRGRLIERWARVGTQPNPWPEVLHRLLPAAEQVEWDAETIESLNLVIISLASTEKANLAAWPRSDTSTLVIDSAGHAATQSLAELGYRVIASEDLQVGMLSRCIHQWTHQSAPLDVLREAIEEYSAV